MEQVTTDDEPVCVGWEGNNWWWEYREVTTDYGVMEQVTTDDEPVCVGWEVTTDDGSIERLQLIMGLWNR